MDIRQLQLTTARDDVVAAIATAPDTVDAAYVFAHGAGAGMDHRFMQAVAEGLAARGVACLRYQFPYMQAGKRRVDGPAVAHDTVRAAVGLSQQLWPATRMFAGGKSFGGRMTSQAQAIAPLPGVQGLVFLGFPLHPAGKPSVTRAEHLADIGIPMLFVRGTRDALAEAAPFDEISARLRPLATRMDIADADHGFSVLRRSGRTDDEVLDETLDAVVAWTQAWRVHPAQ